ncbi:MAG: NAD(P) transhydrogenase subunit alpha [Proteobacteria bacterium]|nr:NAD(P) transhydrogenase subunit alpha [Pseudomonadota bacterium]MDA1131638.1 NAD(P) transhydrogenase subunit alpha [Pseudomonadota bacterium]
MARRSGRRGADRARRQGRASAPGGLVGGDMEVDPLIWELSIFVLAIFVGYYVVWSVTPALHTPLMAITNAISSVIIVGALIAAGPEAASAAKVMGFAAMTLAAINIFGGFVVTQRMLQMFKKKQR